MANGGEGQQSLVKIYVGRMDVFNYALYQNRVSPIRDIQILNMTQDPVEDLLLRVVSDLKIFKDFSAPLPPIPVGKPVTISDLDLGVDGQALADITEAVTANISVQIELNHEVIEEHNGQMKVLAYDEWPGPMYAETLVSFAMPNHPVVSGLLHDAAQRLQKWGKVPSLDGYQQNDPNHVRDLAAAAYAAIQKKNIVYAEPPASFETGQRIRTPEVVMEQRLGTCMDMTMLYASCLEAIGLHPLLVLLKGHIFAGVWLVEKSFDDIVINNRQELIKRFNNKTDELDFIECTSMCSGKAVDFEQAEQIAKYGNLAKPNDFVFAIDIFQARQKNFRPLPSRVKKDGSYQIEIEEKSEDEVTNAPSSLDISVAEAIEPKTKKIQTKEDLWESKLLDISKHNMLLNLPLNASVEPIMSTHVDELEDALADGEEFRLLQAPEFITGIAFTTQDKNGKKSKPKSWLLEKIRESGGVYEMTDWQAGPYDFNSKLRSEYKSHRLYTYCGTKELEKDLTSIYRAARASQQENGVSSLYLAIGLLRWFESTEKDSKPCYAPLVLLPVEIVRKSANQGYALHMRDEEPHFNTTLLEMLKQNYGIEIGGLDPLPGDEHGVDIRKVFATVRGAVISLPYWDVVETCVIGNFSFSQFAMWNDIHNSKDFLEGSKIVRSLMKGYVDFDVTLPSDLDAEKVYLPITVDGTQLRAIKMAAHGTTFVLHGPPGTGKSQTITGMIANLMAQGKSVLFVAEKMAALSVVQKRLSSLGIGDFCLELHSDKASKKQVLTQLEKALNVKRDDRPDDYDEVLGKMKASRSHLDDYKDHLHQVRNCGYSLRELIDLYEGVRDNPKAIPFDPFAVGDITSAMMKQHVALIGQLVAAGSNLDDLSSSPLRNVRVENYSTEVRIGLQTILPEYQKHLADLRDRAEDLANFAGTEVPKSRDDFEKLDYGAAYCIDHAEELKKGQPILNADEEEIQAYYAKKAALETEKEALLRLWQPEFLSMDMNIFQNHYESAEKKLFGKAGALDKVRAEMRGYSIQPITAEQILPLLHAVKLYQQHEAQMESSFNQLSNESKTIVCAYSNESDFEVALSGAQAISQQADSLPGGIAAVLTVVEEPKSRAALKEYHQVYLNCVQSEQSLNNLLQREEKAGKDWYSSEINLIAFLSRNPAALKDWTLYNRARSACIANGLKPVVDAYENGMPASEIIPAYEKGLYRELINYVISSDDVLGSFSGATFNESIRQFKKIDDILLEQSKKEIFNLLAARIPNAWSSPEIGLEVNLLRKAIGSNGRGITIRSLFERIPHIIHKLAPCMLMSPNSVAQYLVKDNNLFDVVIFDEASQLPTSKAIGALARARDAVIVGDPKQMPPTSFFAGAGPQTEDLALDDLDSILDDALALGIPSLHLQWRYRSTHESLIAFSNHEFYDNKMFTFPSANDRERHVSEVHVDGVYSKNINPKEAEAVVEEIVRRYNDKELSKQSIGVITFNVKQQQFIEDLLNKQFQTNPAMDTWANSGEDPLFVKNLENVQGDERDAILFSIGYGPDEKGHVSMNFGPINKHGGGKRLNVAFSRARVSMTIFTSLYSSQITVTESSPDGLVAFRDFLRFAEGHDLDNAQTVDTKKSSREGILNSIMSAITEHGYQCVPMVGHSDFHVDLAVVDPNNPSEYLMGILLDGEGYRRTRNTRDREVAQIGVLKHLGWNLLRVWTIDWWDNRDKEIRKILLQLEELSEQSKETIRNKEVEEAKQNTTANDQSGKKSSEDLAAELAHQAAEVIADEEEENGDGKSMGFGGMETGRAWAIHIPAEKDAADSSADNSDKGEGDSDSNGEKRVTSGTDQVPDDERASESDSSKQWGVNTEIAKPVPYVEASLPKSSMSVEAYTKSDNKKDIQYRICLVMDAEAPILKDSLVRKVLASYGVSKTNASLDATEKALKAAKVKNVKYKGVVFCWRQDQDPKAYSEIRVTTARSGDEISPQEIRNALTYVLENNGAMEKNDLIRAASKVFGYGRMGKNIEAAMSNGLKFARDSGSVVLCADKKYSLAK